MPVVNVALLRGRSAEQKRVLADEISESVSRIAQVGKERVVVLFSDVDDDDWYSGGVSPRGRSQPGQ